MVTIQSEMVKCGKKNCHCVSGEKHGPYFYMYWKVNSKLHKKYLGLTNPYAIKPITKTEIEKLYSDLRIEKMLEEKTPLEKQQEEELYQYEEYKPEISKSEKIRKKNLEKSFEKLSD